MEKEIGVIFTSFVQKARRIVIPRAIWKAYNLEEGDLIEMSLNRVVKKRKYPLRR